ncbi:MAG: hypothetical protein KUL75_08225 [Sterolibacterium sp.]|nr:hypothetical protein [Sterolibacterium sp.]
MAFVPAVIIVLLGSIASVYHSRFFYQADGYMSPKTAVRLVLIEEREASFSGGLSFKRNKEASVYEYRDGRATAFLARINHTDLDIAL